MPSSFGPRFLVFVDTEEEFDWRGPRRRDAVATTAAAALPDAHRRLVGFGITPTYLVDYPVANNPASAAILREIIETGTAEIGAQLHPWVNPPLDEDISSANSFVGNLPSDMERAKLKMLTARIRQSFGVQPVVYRAGRYGVGPNSARLLIEEGYRLDVSIRPHFEYLREGGPDFRRFPVWPWWVDAQRRLIELPLGVARTGQWRDAMLPLEVFSAYVPMLRGLLARTGLLQRVALTPEDMPLDDVLLAIEQMFDAGVSMFSLSFHSPSLQPGHTPYVRDAHDLAAFWRWWDGVLDRLAHLGVAPASATQFIDAARQAC